MSKDETARELERLPADVAALSEARREAATAEPRSSSGEATEAADASDPGPAADFEISLVLRKQA